jgi:polysaccharide export outer membrane protein
MNITSKHSLLWLMLFALLLEGCISGDKFIYMQRKEGNVPAVSPAETYTFAEYTYRIRPKDVLAIQFISTKPSKFTSDKIIEPAGQYILSDTGTIALPVLGVLKLDGMTTSEASHFLQQKINDFFEDVYVQVQSQGYAITLLGEFRQQGMLKVTQERITIYEAIALGGDITDIGDRTQVRLIRRIENSNEAESFHLDLTNDNILSSPFFYLHPDDVLHVKPMRNVKGKQIAQRDIMFYFSFLNVAVFLITIANFIRIGSR